MAEQNNNTRKGRKPLPVDKELGRLQPQAPEVEKAVLGALMIDKDAYAVVCETLRPDSFYEPRNQMVYEAIRDLSMEEKPVDVLTVTEQLAKNGTLEQVGGPVYISELSSHVASSANIEYHAHIVAQKSLARQLISFAGDIETYAFDETSDIDELMQHAEGSLFELSQRNMKKDYTQIDPVIRNAVEVIQKAAQNKDGLTGVSTGYHKLDDITSGWQNSDLVIVAGRPAMGKTAFALSMAKNIAADLQIPMPGQLALSKPGIPTTGGIFLFQGNSLQWVCDLDPSNPTERVILMPGDYQVILRPVDDPDPDEVRTARFTILPAKSTSLTIK